MGYTRYWTRTEKPLTEEFVAEVKEIIKDSEAKGIHICDGSGNGEPMVTTQEVSFNGDDSIGAAHETCYFVTDEEPQWNFCKTARKPYDYTVKRVLEVAEKYGIVTEVSDDGENEMITDAEYIEWAAEMKKKYPQYW